MARDFESADNEYLTVADYSAIDIAGSFTCLTWAQVESDPSSSAMAGLIGKGVAGEASSQNHNYLLGYDNAIFGSGIGTLILYENSTGTNTQARWINTFSADIWINFCGVHDAAGDTLELFTDGTSRATNSSATDTPNTQNQFCFLGRAWNDNTLDWDGFAGMFAVWDTNLSDNEVGALSRGVIPFAIRNQSLVLFVPCYGNQDPEPNFMATTNADLVATPLKAADPPVELIENYL